MRKAVSTVLLCTLLFVSSSIPALAQDSATKTFHVHVKPAPAPKLEWVTADPLPDMQVTIPYSLTFQVTGGVAPFRYAVTAGALPPGISLSTTGVLSGTPTAQGDYTFDINVTDSQGNSTKARVTVTK